MLSSVPSQRTDAGFTLIELLVVILIIGILAAIGIPALLSQRDKAKNSAAKSAVRTALTAAKTLYTEAESFTGLTAEQLKRVEPTLYPTDCNTNAGHQACAPNNDPPVSAALATAFTPGDTAEPKNIWIGRTGLTGSGTDRYIGPGTAPQEVVLCSVSKGDAIACIYDDEASGTITFKEYVEKKTGVPVVDTDTNRLQLDGAEIDPITGWGPAF